MRTVFFGHVADSNLHLAVNMADQAMPVHAIDEVVYGAIGEWEGSISAEHGIGTTKRAFLHHSRTGEEIALMRLLKATLDPNGILNPGKVL
jgi:FAD/FMN-containing dehydrogenase